MSIYDAIANPMVPNIAQATMQGRGLRMQEQQAAQQAQLFPLQLQAAEQAVERGGLEIEQMRNPPRDYARESQRIQALRDGATATSDILAPIVDMDPEQQWAYFQQQAPVLQTLMPDAGLPDSPEELPHYIAGVARLAAVSGTMAERTREIQNLRLQGNDEAADRLESTMEQEYRDAMVPKVGEMAVSPSGERRLIQTQADLQWAIDNGAMPISEATTAVPYEETRLRGDALTTYAATVRTSLDTMDRVDELLAESGDRIVGFAGGLARAVDTAVSQITVLAEQAGGTAVINNNEVSESALRQTELYRDELNGIARRFGVSADDAAALRSNLVNLAYLLARSARPDGRLAQADIKAQLEVITANGGSASQIRSALSEARTFSMTQMSNMFEEMGQPLPEWWSGYQSQQPRPVPGQQTDGGTEQPRRVPPNVTPEAIRAELERRRRNQ